jgi:hypothetical protein
LKSSSAKFSELQTLPLCGVPSVRDLSPTSVAIRVPVTSGGFVDAFFNEQTGTIAFALIQEGKRIFGADNTGGWHVHPFDDPEKHEKLSGEMAFATFVAAIEQHSSDVRESQ